GVSSSIARVSAPLSAMLAPRTAQGMGVTGPGSSDPDAIIEWLNDNLFTDANYLGNGIYKVPPEMVCSVDSVDSSGNVTTTIDPDCAEPLELAQRRVRVEEDATRALWFGLQIKPDHDEPLSFLLAH